MGGSTIRKRLDQHHRTGLSVVTWAPAKFGAKIARLLTNAKRPDFMAAGSGHQHTPGWKLDGNSPPSSPFPGSQVGLAPALQSAQKKRGRAMKRLAGAFALACLPTLIAAQAPGSDRLNARSVSRIRDRVRSADLAGRLADHLHARLGRQAGRPARNVAVGHERRRQQEPLPGARQQRALVADRRSHRLHRAGRAARLADLRPLHGRGRRRLADHARREGADRRSRGRPTAPRSASR